MNKPYEAVGLTAEEYAKVVEYLNREPNELELNMYGVMWSEHCSYKHSRSLFKHFPTTGKRVLQGPGENAGIVDIGDNLAIAMKIESHNHPSAIEPYQGAATGVGGIIRDIFAMGARPIALLNSLRFGDVENSERVKYLLEGVVEGIAGYGNCIGIPTVGGEVNFNNSYNGNPLVNAMCVGVIEHDKIHRGNASGVGNSIMYVGAATGRDGMGGASFASVELSDESEEKRSAVQVGDPFMEKLLMEACLELLQTGSVVGIQDLGAAGLTSACCETATRGEGGMEIDVLKVPRREKGMLPVEVMISESQERMLIIVEKGREDEVTKIVEKWGLHSVIIGKVTDNGRLIVKEGDVVVGDMPAHSLDSSGAPKYYKDYEVPQYYRDVKKFTSSDVEEPTDLNQTIMELLKSPNIASKEWVYKQYDHMVRTSTVVKPGSDAAVLKLRGTKKGIALTTDCNSRYCYLDPREGSKIAVAEAARNIVASGGKPIAVTDGLNFGNPEKPDRYWQFRESIVGIGEACRELDTPVISGNVSLYNETESQAIHPTPMIGMVGVLDNVENHCTMAFKSEGDVIILVGDTKDEIGGSEYLARIHNLEMGEVPHLNFALEKKVQNFVLESIEKGLLESAHDLSEGGLAIGLAESCMDHGVGATINLETKLRKDVALFSESQSRFIITVKASVLEEIEGNLLREKIPFTRLGEVAGKELKININSEEVINLSVNQMEDAWRGALECLIH
ncbi:phosphoribosylformylglycinamidine synthase subunit PurL [Alkaliphilus transvaalensis]|uniref:phosphoribosylformylglycinamidine synthase subunit PurL n=1 Tax=Alkaliphilus transvaalensis TaxID=114628 RepID=UPI00047B88CE|nr:phosphoribosylformylglycinamidine synthase subunit PurL [Alkaliphilus transvaalensis]